MSTEARGTTLDWSFPMNPSQLPPKSPGSFPSFGAAIGPGDSTAAAAAGRATNLPHRAGAHKRTPSAGYLPQAHSTWMDAEVDAGAPSAGEPPPGPSKRGAAAHGHRRAASESCMAFLQDDGTASDYNMVDDADLPCNVDDDDFESRSAASMHSAGHSGAGSVDFDIDRLDEDQLMSMFGNGNELNQKLQPQPRQSQPESNWKSSTETTTAGGATSSATNAGGSEARAATQRGPPKPCNADPCTPSDCSNSASEVSNEDPKGGLGNVYQSEPDVQSSGDREGGSGPQSLSKGESQAALAGPDSSLDPKRAKRILANRQSAQRSRVRKLQYISELERTVTALQSEVSTMAPRVAFFEHRRAVLNVDNNAIKQKMAALAQGQLFKDAHNEALQKEVQRLRQLLLQQQQHSQSMQQQHPHSQSAAPATSHDLRHRQFHELEPGAAQPSDSSVAAVPDMFAGGLGATADSISSGGASPTRPRAHAVPHHSLNTLVASTW